MNVVKYTKEHAWQKILFIIKRDTVKRDVQYVNITAVPGTLIQNSIAEDDETNRSRRLALLRTALSSCPIVAKD